MEERAFWLAWSQIPGIGPILLRRLHQHFGTLSEAWKANPAALREVEGFGRQTIEGVVEKRLRLHPQQFLEEHLVKNPCFWTPADADYPRLLLETPTPPPVLYYRGKVQLQENHGITPTIGIVGTRQPSEYGRRWTSKITDALTKSGFTIVSGMADGIDTEAHRVCIEAGGRTLAVFGTGVDVVYPWRNKSLYEQICDRGLALSEYPAGTQPKREHFPPRNRIIAGLSRAVLVMEAPTRSGSLITADYANEFCRDVYALPARLDDRQSLGCLKLISKGATPFLDENHLLEMLGAIPKLDPVQQLDLFNQPPVPDLEPELKQIWQAISSEPTAFDLIVQQTGKPANSVSSALLQLELMGLVSQLPGMRYQKC
nr:DNA-processing protein DprA [Coleofasciculus sp. FACHB-1120]